MRLDTGAHVTLLRVKDWIKINYPKCLPPPVKLRSANNKDIKFVHISSATPISLDKEEEEPAALRIHSPCFA
ncbi:unnamed protein product [Toxocara canis]|uniref:Peptidase A2 domain-containing protein n=1 Tax=Toxocara canis TaxID=6265 RepID=A0A183UY28_TOXCA|nr:unnamed protein product [Toxocara canis]